MASRSLSHGYVPDPTFMVVLPFPKIKGEVERFGLREGIVGGWIRSDDAAFTP